MDLDSRTPEMLTARDVIADRALSAVIHCSSCNMRSEFDVWKVGVRLGDTPLHHLKLVCRRCRTRATAVSIIRMNVGVRETVMTVPLKRPVTGYGSGQWFEP